MGKKETKIKVIETGKKKEQKGAKSKHEKQEYEDQK